MTPEFTPYTPEHADAVREFAQVVAEVDGIEAFGEQTLFNLSSMEAEHFLIRKPAGAGTASTLGYAQVDRHSAELAVHPAHRRNGIGTALLDAVKSRDPSAAVWAHGNLDGAKALAVSRGLEVTRELVYMTAQLSELHLPSPPAGVRVHTFTPEDAPEWLAVNAAAFAEHPEQGRLTQKDLDERMNQPWFTPETFWLARDERGELLGYMWVKREPQAQAAEIYVLGVSPGAQGRGVGKFLTQYALARMHATGVKEMDLYVEGDNTPAIATYTQYGFTRAVTHVQYT